MLAGLPGTKTFWTGENDYWLAAGAQCRGCGSAVSSKLALRTIYETTRDVLVFGRSCGGGKSELGLANMGNDGSGIRGLEMALKLRGAGGKRFVLLDGDGRTLDMGGGNFLASLDGNHRVTWIIWDNNAFAESGSHKVSTTPLKARTRIFLKGKATPASNMPLMMINSQARFVATAAPAYVRDFVIKVRKALMMTPSYIHVLTPCQVTWGYQPRECIHISRLSVLTGMHPLWECEDGVLNRTVRVPERLPVQEFLGRQRRYDHLQEADIAEIQEYADKLNERIERLESGLGKSQFK